MGEFPFAFILPERSWRLTHADTLVGASHNVVSFSSNLVQWKWALSLLQTPPAKQPTNWQTQHLTFQLINGNQQPKKYPRCPKISIHSRCHRLKRHPSPKTPSMLWQLQRKRWSCHMSRFKNTLVCLINICTRRVGAKGMVLLGCFNPCQKYLD